MNRIAGVVIVVVGIILVAWGINSSNSVGSSISRVFTGSPTDKSVWLVVGGAVLALAGGSVAWSPWSKRE